MAASGELSKPWTTDEELRQAGKKKIVEFLQANAPQPLLGAFKLEGPLSKTAFAKLKLDHVMLAYHQLYSGAWGQVTVLPSASQRDKMPISEIGGPSSDKPVVAAAAASEGDGSPKFTLQTLAKGDKVNFPKNKDKVQIKYKGSLASTGKVFDSNMGKRDKPLTVVIGNGKMIRGMEEALLQMSVGETAQVNIESDWAYGAKGIPGLIPPDSDLVFELTLVRID